MGTIAGKRCGVGAHLSRANVEQDRRREGDTFRNELAYSLYHGLSKGNVNFSPEWKPRLGNPGSRLVMALTCHMILGKSPHFLEAQGSMLSYVQWIS